MFWWRFGGWPTEGQNSKILTRKEGVRVQKTKKNTQSNHHENLNLVFHHTHPVLPNAPGRSYLDSCEETPMKLRTIRTFDEIEAFYTMIRDQYSPHYLRPRLSPVHYGVFDVGEDTRGWGEGERLVAGAAININGWDIFEEGGVTAAWFESLIVKPEFRNRGTGRALLNFIVESHCDLTIGLRVSKNDEWQRLVPWYERFAFIVTSHGDEVFMERKPDDDGGFVAPELRERAANWRYGDDRDGLELDEFNP